MRNRLCKLFFAYAALSCATISCFPQTASPSPTLVTATCGLPVCTWNAFGLTVYTRGTGKPQAVSDTFSVLNPNTRYTLHVDNSSVPSAVMSVNDVQIVGPSDFDPHVVVLDRAVTLTTRNIVSVELRGKPEASLAITVIGVDNDPPSILELVAPPANEFGWNNTSVSVSFFCSDATSGIAFCPAPLLLNTEGLNQVAAGTAVDVALNSSTSSLKVNIDLTPPTIAALASPAPNAAGWNNSPVTVNFTCADTLSGVASCPAPVTVSSEGANQQVSGTAVDKAGNGARTSTDLNIDETPPVVSITSPANAVTVTTSSIQVAGMISDNLSGVASVSCNGANGVISGGTFICNVSLVAGVNTVQIRAVDKAGNVANTQIGITFNANPGPPPKSILVTPSTVNMLVGDIHLLRLVGDVGQVVTGASWSISDPAIVTINSADPPQLTATAQGTATLTATVNGLTAAMTIKVLPGTALSAGTVLWSFDPLPGNTITQMVPGNPVNFGDPDIFAVEAPNTLRAFTKDGLQLWAVSVGASPSSAATAALPSGIQQNVLSAQSQATLTGLDPTQTLASIPGSAQDVLREHGAFDSLDLLLRQKRFIEQQRGRASPRSTMANSFSTISPSLAVPSANTVASDLTTLLIKAVPDNGGGVINLVETFSGCCSVLRTSFIKIDNATQRQVWRHDFTGSVDANFAIGGDSTVYSSQLIFPPISNPFAAAFGSASASNIFALAGDTGEQVFTIALPPGHFKLTNLQGGLTPAILADVDLAAQPSPLSILPDGSINAIVYTNHLEEDFHNLFSFSGFESGVSDHKTLQLLTIQPDGSFATQSIQGFDFSATSCPTGCNDPGAGYIPNEVIPDGQGGLLATWTGNDTQLGITRNSAALVRHFNNAGGTLDYVVPFLSSSWFRIGGDNPQSLTLGDNNTAFGTDGQSIIAFDLNTGSQLWNFIPGNFQGSALLGGTNQSGVAAIQLADFQGEFDDTPNALLSFDSTGAVIETPFAATSVSSFDATTLLAVAANVGERLLASASLNQNDLWFPPGYLAQRSPTPPRITYDKRTVTAGLSLINQDVRGTLIATISPKSSASQVTFTSTNKARATVSEESRVDGPDSTIVTLKVTGIGATPIDKPEGDAQVQALFRRNNVGIKVPVLVVVPTTQEHAIGQTTLINTSFQMTTAPFKFVLRTDISNIITITIKDQFGHVLDPIFDGPNVVTESSSDVSPPGCTDTQERLIVLPDNMLRGGIKLDETGSSLDFAPNSIVTDQQKLDWANQLPVLDHKNSFALAGKGDSCSMIQTIRVHGFVVTPNFLRTQAVTPVDQPPIPYMIMEKVSIQ